MKKLVVLLVLVVAVSVVSSPNVYAETITIFDSNSTISDGNSFDTVVVKGDDTVVDMTGGDVNTVITMNASTFNMSGGNVAIVVCSYDSSVLSLSGGIVERLKCYGNSRANILDNIIIDRDEWELVGLSGIFSDSTLITVSGGDILGELYVNGQSTLKVAGGIISGVRVTDGSPKIDLSGGMIGTLYRYSIVTSLGCTRIIGYDLDAVPYGGTKQQGQVTGYWNDDTPFSINLHDGAYSIVELYDGVIPPECINKPESDLSGDCTVNFIDFTKMASEWLYDGTY